MEEQLGVSGATNRYPMKGIEKGDRIENLIAPTLLHFPAFSPVARAKQKSDTSRCPTPSHCNPLAPYSNSPVLIQKANAIEKRGIHRIPSSLSEGLMTEQHKRK
jgi:hypothetical protein